MWKLIILAALCIHYTVCVNVTITPIPGPPTNLTDSIFWSPKDNSLYYADYYTDGNQPSIYRYDFNQQTFHAAYIEGKTKIAYLLPVKECGNFVEPLLYNDNLFMAGVKHDNFLTVWNGIEPVAKVIRTVFQIEADYPSSDMDLSAQNARGQFFGGTTTDQYCGGSSNSSFYAYSTVRGVRKIFTGFQATTGISFFGDTIYHSDICQQKITELKKDFFGNYVSRVVFDFTIEDSATHPSGLEIDTEGILYVVGYTNGKVWRIDPKTSTGEVITTIPYFLTGVAFGGPNRDILYVLTASALVQAWPLAELYYQQAPPLFTITGLGAKGIVSERLQCLL